MNNPDSTTIFIDCPFSQPAPLFPDLHRLQAFAQDFMTNISQHTNLDQSLFHSSWSTREPLRLVTLFALQEQSLPLFQLLDSFLFDDTHRLGCIQSAISMRSNTIARYIIETYPTIYHQLSPGWVMNHVLTNNSLQGLEFLKLLINTLDPTLGPKLHTKFIKIQGGETEYPIVFAFPYAIIFRYLLDQVKVSFVPFYNAMIEQENEQNEQIDYQPKKDEESPGNIQSSDHSNIIANKMNYCSNEDQSEFKNCSKWFEETLSNCLAVRGELYFYFKFPQASFNIDDIVPSTLMHPDYITIIKSRPHPATTLGQFFSSIPKLLPSAWNRIILKSLSKILQLKPRSSKLLSLFQFLSLFYNIKAPVDHSALNDLCSRFVPVYASLVPQNCFLVSPHYQYPMLLRIIISVPQVIDQIGELECDKSYSLQDVKDVQEILPLQQEKRCKFIDQSILDDLLLISLALNSYGVSKALIDCGASIESVFNTERRLGTVRAHLKQEPKTAVPVESIRLEDIFARNRASNCLRKEEGQSFRTPSISLPALILTDYCSSEQIEFYTWLLQEAHVPIFKQCINQKVVVHKAASFVSEGNRLTPLSSVLLASVLKPPTRKEPIIFSIIHDLIIKHGANPYTTTSSLEDLAYRKTDSEKGNVRDSCPDIPLSLVDRRLQLPLNHAAVLVDADQFIEALIETEITRLIDGSC